MGIKRVKIKGRGRDRWRITLRLSVVERWKGKREVMIGNSGEKWEISRWCGADVAQQKRSNNNDYASAFIYIYIYIYINNIDK